ncbi:MAG: hypothetical protein V3V62_04070 [bacterium]
MRARGIRRRSWRWDALPAILALALLAGGCGGAGGGGGISFAAAAARNSPAAYREFLFRHPKHPRAAEIRRLLDKADFEEASNKHTAEEYRRYLNEHPDGEFVRRARHWEERLSYFDAVSRKDAEALRKFLDRHPKSRFAAGAGSSLQKAELKALRTKESIAGYRAFLERHRNRPSELTAEATQRLERLLLDEAKLRRDETALSRYIYDNPDSPYLEEARTELRRLSFDRVIYSSSEAEWLKFIRRFKGTEEAAVVSKHMEDEALRGAERSGRVAALERFLERYPESPHKQRIRATIAVMIRERNSEAPRWVRIKGAEIELSRPRGCAKCKPEVRVRGILVSNDPDFAFDLTLVAFLVRGGKRCCRTHHEVKALRPGERRPFSFDIPGAPTSGPPPAFKVRVLEGKAYQDRSARRRINIPGLGSEKTPGDRFAPQPVKSPPK